ncbi:serine hydrolase domain-containing protein [Caulobacter sp. NIBR1757]|uniref:serine hydrolase domain-containing protein n=1 Tax=Caulobacter sp. NIBR1757 TaxID=3016000 RepID=UPI0022F12205|nr:serine hydrolase domain-containing protein [Caulobacter sp. NIBR1757]WGM38404.1 Putative D-alanyl-D-alanine carboxypeptidase [Caulobacter sp. NIBR1757]
MSVKSVLKGGLAAVLSLVVGAAPVAGAAQAPAAATPAAPIPYTPAPTAQPKAAARPARPPTRPRAVAAAATQPAAPVANVVAPVAPIDPAQLEAFVDGVVSTSMSRDHIAGVTVSIVQNGQVVLKKGYGFDRLGEHPRRVDPDRSLFRLASISKTFTWISVMRQVEAGRMRLDAPINLYLPESVRVPDQGFAKEIRVIDLMNHRPGFEDRALGQLFEKDPARVRPILTWLKQERPRREWEAGTIPAYSNYGVALAGLAAARQVNKPFEQMIEQEITGPLGMSRTTFRDRYPGRAELPAPMPANLAGDVSDGFFWNGTRFTPRPYEFVSQAAPAGAASSTAGDMARYMTMLLNGGTLDGQTIFNPQTSAGFRAVSDRAAPGAGGFAHGFIEYRLPGNRLGYGHDGATLTFMSNMTVIPELGLGVFISTNTETGANLSGALAGKVVERFYGPPPAAPRLSQWLKDNRGDFAGQYLSSRRAFHGLEKLVGLFNGRQTVQVDGQGQLVLSGFDGASIWTPLDTAGRFQSTTDARVIAFTLQDGRATGFYDSAASRYSKRLNLFGDDGWLIWTALLAGLASIVTVVGALLRLRLNLRQTTVQARASLIQTIQAVLWLIMLVSFGLWFGKVGDVAAIFYDWPGPLLIIASSCGLVAAILSVVVVILTPFVWRGGRRVDSFTQGRKLRFTWTAGVFLLFSVVLAGWGAIFPWAN